MQRIKVIIIGGGFGGLNAAQALKKMPVDLLVLDKANHHLFQPLLYQVATAALSPGNIASPIREILRYQQNTTVLMAEIIAIDKERREVIAANGDRYAYDYLIVATGSSHSYFGHSEWESMAPGLKTLNDALKIRERILLSYERAERCDDPAEAERFLRFIIIGGGPTGVEMAGSIGEIALLSLEKNFRRINPHQTKVFLIEGESQVLPSFSPKLGVKAKAALEKLGVEVILNTRVTDVTPEGVIVGDRFLESSHIIWAAGNEASSLLKTLKIPLDRHGRAIVQSDLSIPDHPEVFIIGDAAMSVDNLGRALPGIAPVAIQQGRYIANLIKNDLEKTKRSPFKYKDKGMLATIGKDKAVGVIGKFQISGYLAWLSWSLIHIFFLISFANRTLVMMQWFFLYITNRRRIRLITRPISDKDDPFR